MKKNAFLACISAVLVLSVSLAFAAAPKVYTPFNGKNLEGWVPTGQSPASPWTVVKDVRLSEENPRELVPVAGEFESGVLFNPSRAINLMTMQHFGDITIELEFMISQGSNSGVYPMGLYEVQIHDSYGKPVDQLHQGDMGAIYSAAAPMVNASRPAGEWQHFIIEFVAPRFNDDGEKISNALFKRVVLNGVLVQENVEAPGPTGGGISDTETATGPLMFQGTHGPIAYRNIKVTVNDQPAVGAPVRVMYRAPFPRLRALFRN